MPGDPIQSHNQDDCDYLSMLEHRVGHYSTNQWKDLIDKDIEQPTFIAGCIFQASEVNPTRFLRAIHALMVDPELAISATEWLYQPINQSTSADSPHSFIAWLLHSINLECSTECLTELFAVLILSCQSINHSNEQAVNESIKAMPNDLLQDACFTCLIVSHSTHETLHELAAIVLLILDRFNHINQANNQSSSLLLSMIQPSSIHLILYEAAQEADNSLGLVDQSVDEYARSNVLTPVINQSLHCLNTGNISPSINQLINPCYDQSSNQPIIDFFVVAPVHLFHAILSTNQFSLVYSNDLLVLADILSQLVEDRAGDEHTNDQQTGDVCAIALECLIRLIDGWPDLKQRSAGKRERFARAARSSVSSNDLSVGKDSERQAVARRLSAVIQQWTDEVAE